MKMLRSTVPASGSLPPFPLQLQHPCSSWFYLFSGPEYNSHAKNCPENEIYVTLNRKVWAAVSKPSLYEESICNTLTLPLTEYKRWRVAHGDTCPYWLRGRVPGTLTGLCKAMWPSASQLNHFQTLSLLAKGINNNLCPTHITGCLGRSNKTYLEALFKSVKHHIYGSSLIPTI